MNSDFLIVNKKILPHYYEKVVQARKLLNSQKCKSVSEATKKVGISRNTYYKYKDFIFEPTKLTGQRFTISLKLDDKPGLLSKILTEIDNQSANIVTIHQDIPINDNAIVGITLNAQNMKLSIKDLIDILLKIDGVNDINLLNLE